MFVVADHHPVAGASLLATREHFLGDGWTPEPTRFLDPRHRLW
ncbi:hypothetical protein ACIRRA_33415 [Nocardia sp. NPDC101769]